jgi:nucleoside-diphosphate kinase
METTFLFVKPDGVQRHLVGRILSRLEARGLQIVALRMRTLPRELAETHYGEHAQRPFFPRLIEYVTSGPVVLMAVRGLRAVEVCRTLIGSTFCPDAAPGTIRGDLGISSAYNLIHGSDSPASAERELKLFFEDGDFVDYTFQDLGVLINLDEEV